MLAVWTSVEFAFNLEHTTAASIEVHVQYRRVNERERGREQTRRRKTQKDMVSFFFELLFCLGINTRAQQQQKEKNE